MQPHIVLREIGLLTFLNDQGVKPSEDVEREVTNLIGEAAAYLKRARRARFPHPVVHTTRAELECVRLWLLRDELREWEREEREEELRRILEIAAPDDCEPFKRFSQNHDRETPRASPFLWIPRPLGGRGLEERAEVAAKGRDCANG